MNSSSRATSSLRETYTVCGAVVHRTPSASHASQKIARISAERLLKEYRGERQFRPVFMNRQPSGLDEPAQQSVGMPIDQHVLPVE